jgi:hypothetical protein
MMLYGAMYCEKLIPALSTPGINSDLQFYQ